MHTWMRPPDLSVRRCQSACIHACITHISSMYMHLWKDVPAKMHVYICTYTHKTTHTQTPMHRRTLAKVLCKSIMCVLHMFLYICSHICTRILTHISVGNDTRTHMSCGTQSANSVGNDVGNDTCTHMSRGTQSANKGIDEAATKLLAELPRATADIKSVAHDASILAHQVAQVRCSMLTCIWSMYMHQVAQVLYADCFLPSVTSTTVHMSFWFSTRRVIICIGCIIHRMTVRCSTRRFIPGKLMFSGARTGCGQSIGGGEKRPADCRRYVALRSGGLARLACIWNFSWRLHSKL